MNGKFILDGHTPKPVDGLLEWGRWFETAERHVADDKFENGVHVSTVFLGIDHNWGLDDDPRPLLFETMVFGGPLDGEQERWHTWEEAEAGHAAMLSRCAEATNTTTNTAHPVQKRPVS